MEKTLQSETVYGGRKLRLQVDQVELPSGRRTTREVVYHPGSVGIVPVTREGDVFLIKQYRYAVGSAIYEIPAGTMEKWESPEKCAMRELEEETGFIARKLEKLGQFYTSPGIMNEIMHLYKATHLVKAGKARPPEEENIEVVRIRLSQAIDMIKKGEIMDGKTICGIFWVVCAAPPKETY